MVESKPEEDNVILTLLIYFIGFSGIYNLYQGYQDFITYVLDPETFILFSIIIILYYIGLITFHIYSIVLLSKEKINAIFSTKLLFILLILVNLFQLLWINFINEGYEFVSWIIIWILFYIAFLIYMYKSKEVTEKFLKKKIPKKLISILLFISTLLLSLFLWITMFAIQHLVNKGIIPLE